MKVVPVDVIELYLNFFFKLSLLQLLQFFKVSVVCFRLPDFDGLKMKVPHN